MKSIEKILNKKNFLYFKNKNPTDQLKIKHTKKISSESVLDIYKSVNWRTRSLDLIKKSLENSFLVTTVWREDLLIGFARATGDGVFNVTIWDVVVRPEYQKKGIGKLLIKSMLTKLYDHGILLITLFSEYNNKRFYDKLGFTTDSTKIIGMYKNKN